jgi:hypothetical protein
MNENIYTEILVFSFFSSKVYVESRFNLLILFIKKKKYYPQIIKWTTA